MASDRGQKSLNEPTVYDGRSGIVSRLRGATRRNYKENGDSETDFSSTSEGNVYMPNISDSDSIENEGL